MCRLVWIKGEGDIWGTVVGCWVIQMCNHRWQQCASDGVGMKQGEQGVLQRKVGSSMLVIVKELWFCNPVAGFGLVVVCQT